MAQLERRGGAFEEPVKRVKVVVDNGEGVLDHSKKSVVRLAALS